MVLPGLPPLQHACGSPGHPAQVQVLGRRPGVDLGVCIPNTLPSDTPAGPQTVQAGGTGTRLVVCMYSVGV